MRKLPSIFVTCAMVTTIVRRGSPATSLARGNLPQGAPFFGGDFQTVSPVLSMVQWGTSSYTHG